MKHTFYVLAFAGLASITACGNDNSSAAEQQKIQEAARLQTIDSMKTVLERQHVIDSMNEVARIEKEAADASQKEAAAATVVARTGSTRRSTGTRSVSSAPSPAANPVYESPAPAAQKKGWSAKAKGAVIGAGVGAASGAIINKRNRGAGAVIGGIGGAAVGTGVGAVIDKKNGR